MPTSQYFQISKIIDLIIKINPKSIFDVGVGFGKYGVLCREYLELWDGKGKYNDFCVIIDGIEAFKDYITPLHKFIYNNIYLNDVFELIKEKDLSYDLVLLIDVLEHFEKEKGKLLIKKLLKTNQGILISIPKVVSKQENCFGNKYETHRSRWSKKELKHLGNALFLLDPTSYIVYIGKKEIVKNLRNKIVFQYIKNKIKIIIKR